jgi:hypothetical protein
MLTNRYYDPPRKDWAGRSTEEVKRNYKADRAKLMRLLKTTSQRNPAVRQLKADVAKMRLVLDARGEEVD